jgi:hypothetical protein
MPHDPSVLLSRAPAARARASRALLRRLAPPPKWLACACAMDTDGDKSATSPGVRTAGGDDGVDDDDTSALLGAPYRTGAIRVRARLAPDRVPAALAASWSARHSSLLARLSASSAARSSRAQARPRSVRRRACPSWACTARRLPLPRRRLPPRRTSRNSRPRSGPWPSIRCM